jgi:ubiquinone biosynthesis monooxygenase Coq7
MQRRNYSWMDGLVMGADDALRSLSGTLPNKRPTPAQGQEEPILNEDERRHAAGLMRINHAGEICAQALYRGQAISSRDPELQQELRSAAEEEADHLAWCAARLRELDSRPSRLDPVWYLCSWTLGACAGLFGRKINLGFLAATERQVSRHLGEHLEKLPRADSKSRAVVAQMLKEESAHADNAMDSGGLAFSERVQNIMYQVSRLMVYSSYRI